MTNGIVQIKDGFAVQDFETGHITQTLFNIGNIKFESYEEAIKECCGKFYPASFEPYLLKAAELDKAPDADTWENMIYAEDPRGVWDGEQLEYRNVTSMDRGAATVKEIAYIDALDATYRSLMAMIG